MPSEPSSRKVWAAASAVVLDVETARRCVELGLPRRGRVLLIGRAEPRPGSGRSRSPSACNGCSSCPSSEADLVAELSEAAESRRAERRGAVLAVIGGRGGAGASVFATALAHAAPRGAARRRRSRGAAESIWRSAAKRDAGLRWPDLAVQGGTVGYRGTARCAAVHATASTVLSAGRAAGDDRRGRTRRGDRRGPARRRHGHLRPAAPSAPRRWKPRSTPPISSCSSPPPTSGRAPPRRPPRQWLVAANPNVGLVVRGPAARRAAFGRRRTDHGAAAARGDAAATWPGGRCSSTAGCGLRRRSPLASAARRVLDGAASPARSPCGRSAA